MSARSAVARSMTAPPPWAVISDERRAHVQRVADLVEQWAEALATPGEERNRWRRAVWLHDALRDAPDEELARLVPDEAGPAELRHGPAAASRARREGEDDQGVLNAVRYHSLGLAEWDAVGRVLYCADFLEPGRRFERERRALLARRYPEAPDEVLYHVVQERMRWLIRSGWSIPETTWRFWNALAQAQA